MNKQNALIAIVVINLMYVLMAVGAFFVHRQEGDHGFWMTLITGVFGVICGWLIGILSSPLDTRESQAFTRYAGIISGFVGGYLFTRLDGVITGISDQLLVNPVYGLRVLIFISCLISGILIMYIFRAYLHGRQNTGE